MVFREHEVHRGRFGEIEYAQSIGVGLYIIGPGKTIWATIEIDDNSVMEKNGGQLSIPAERRKINESLWGNIYGALGEFCSGEDAPILSGRLFIVGKPVLSRVIISNKESLYTLVPMACYADIQPTPFDIKEVRLKNGWKRPENMLLNSNLRSLARQLIKVGEEEKFWEKGLDGFTKSANRIPVFGPHFSGKDFNEFSRDRSIHGTVIG